MLRRSVRGQVCNSSQRSSAPDIHDGSRTVAALRTGDQAWLLHLLLLAHAADCFRAHVPSARRVHGHDALEHIVRRHFAFGRTDAGTVDEAIKATGDGVNEALAGGTGYNVTSSNVVDIRVIGEFSWRFFCDISDVN